MTQTASDNYFVKSPEKVYKTADTFSKTLQRFTNLPSSISKTLDIKNFAEDKTDDIRYVIQQEKYQNQLYKRLQKADAKIRKSIAVKIEEKDNKNQANLDQIQKKHEKDCQKIQKHLSQIYKKHVEIQKSKKMDKDQEALKLRQSLLEFYDKQKHRKKQADLKQLSVSTCYQDAVGRLQKIHQKNQEYAQKSQRQHLLRMARNSARDRNLLNLSRMKSAQNRKKQCVYIQNCQILKSKQHRYIQTYCKDLDQSLKAFDYKQNVQQKAKQRIQKFFKDRVQKWQTVKKRVDQQKQHVDQRCIDLMDKSSKAFFRQTVSSFKDSGKNWFNKVQQNKSMIYEKDQRAKDRIMNIHLDLRLRNTSNFKINERMLSMRGQAKKLSHEFM